MRYSELITENDDDDLFGAEPTKQGRTAQRSIDYARHRPRKNSTAQYYLVAPDQDLIARATADKARIDKLEHYARGYAQSYIDDGYMPDDTMQVVFRKLNQGMEDTVVARVWPLSRLVGLREDEDGRPLPPPLPRVGEGRGLSADPCKVPPRKDTVVS